MNLDAPNPLPGGSGLSFLRKYTSQFTDDAIFKGFRSAWNILHVRDADGDDGGGDDVDICDIEVVIGWALHLRTSIWCSSDWIGWWCWWYWWWLSWLFWSSRSCRVYQSNKIQLFSGVVFCVCSFTLFGDNSLFCTVYMVVSSMYEFSVLFLFNSNFPQSCQTPTDL